MYMHIYDINPTHTGCTHTFYFNQSYPSHYGPEVNSLLTQTNTRNLSWGKGGQ